MQVGSWSSSSLTKLEREEFKIYYRKKIADVFCILFVCNFLRSVRIIFFFSGQMDGSVGSNGGLEKFNTDDNNPTTLLNCQGLKNGSWLT